MQNTPNGFSVSISCTELFVFFQHRIASGQRQGFRKDRSHYGGNDGGGCSECVQEGEEDGEIGLALFAGIITER